MVNFPIGRGISTAQREELRASSAELRENSRTAASSFWLLAEQPGRSCKLQGNSQTAGVWVVSVGVNPIPAITLLKP